VVSTGSYSSRVHVLNVDTFGSSVSVYYYGAAGTSSPGYRSCGLLNIGSGQTANFDFKTQCGLGAGSHYGILELNAGAYINAYSRVSSAQGNGFSVEGFPAGNFYGEGLTVLGAKKSAIAPGYQTNCFVGSFGEAANYSITLYQSSGAQIGSTILGSVAANELRRYLDIFATAGIAQAELADVSVVITSTNINKPALMAFCTVQNNTSFDADFRIAKSRWGSGATSVKFVPNATPILPFTSWVKHRYVAALKAPDVLGCWLNSPYDSVLEMQLRGPNGLIWAGGNGASSYTVTIGPKSAIAGGNDDVWVLEVSPREITQSFPIYYTFNCYAGNGMSRPAQLVDGVDDF
jgi:hypothetical protein